jgi:Tol biopolymer transport system component
VSPTSSAGPSVWTLRRTTPAVAAAVVLALLLAVVAAGLQVAGVAALRGLPLLGPLDYRGLNSGGFAPLRDDYVEAVLGTSLGARGGTQLGPSAQPPAGAASQQAAPAPQAAPKAVLGDASPPTAVQHAFTNDGFEQAQVVPALPYDARTTTIRASRQEGEPTSCSQTGGTAWYRFTPSEDSRLIADTFGTEGATALGVFTGSRLRELSQVACSSDATGGAQVSFPVTARKTYFFQVTGVVGDTRLVFHLSPLGTTSLASVSRQDPGEYHRFAAVSGDGEVVAYSTQLGPDCLEAGVCREQTAQIVVLERRTGRRTVVSLTPHGNPGNGVSYLPTLSYDGRYVGFSSHAADLVPGDSNGSADYFVHDRRSGRTVRASVTSDGRQGRPVPDSASKLVHGMLSANGRFAAFATAEQLSEDDLNLLHYDIYVHDLKTGRTSIESVANDGGRATQQSDSPTISADGRWLSFSTAADELDGRTEPCEGGRGETRTCFSVLLRDRASGRNQVVSRRMDGEPDVLSGRASISADGSTVVWTSTNDRLVDGDNNGMVDTFAWDRRTRRTTRVSVTSTGGEQVDATPAGVAQADRSFLTAGVRFAAASADGRYVVFDSRAGNLAAGDANGSADVFRHDRLTGSTRRISLSEAGQEGRGDSVRAAVSADGQVVVFESDAQLGPGDTDAATDVFVHAPRTGERRGMLP